MRLNDPLKNTLTFDGVKYSVNMSFNNILDVLDVLKDSRLFMGMKLKIIIKLLFGRETLLPKEYWWEAWKIVKENWIDVASKESVQYDIMGDPMPVERAASTLDFELDAKYIYASFRFAGINLYQEHGKMHWEEFQALLESLPEDSIIQRIRSIRSQSYEGLSSKQKQELMKLKARYALPSAGEEEEDE